jgi:cyclopropane-fatty-acyl-phospholipid synthase
MNRISRTLAATYESVVFGPVYGTLQYLIRSPEPLDPDATWTLLTRELHPVADWARWNWPPTFMRSFLVAAKTRQDHLIGISHHYDISNEFWELWLDRKYMLYSSADFPDGSESLEQAQTIKVHALLALIQPKAGERILDLGSGWNGMLRPIYEETGDKKNLSGYTLSQYQLDYNRAHEGFNVELRNFITTEYPKESFDKILATGTMEHVRPNELYPLAVKLFRALKPGGSLTLQTNIRLATPLPATVIAAQIFFPGSMATPLMRFVRHFERAGFRIVHRSFGDYRLTLRHWFMRLGANRDRAVALVGVRAYNRFLVYLCSAWRWHHDGVGTVLRLSMIKPDLYKCQQNGLCARTDSITARFDRSPARQDQATASPRPAQVQSTPAGGW